MCMVAPLSRIIRQSLLLGKGWLELAHFARMCEATEYVEELEYSITSTLLVLSLTATIVGAGITAEGVEAVIRGAGGAGAWVASYSVRARVFMYVRKLQVEDGWFLMRQ